MMPESVVWLTRDLDAVAAAIRERGIVPARLDAGYSGELRDLFSNAGVRVQYCKSSGMTVDALGEFLADRGFIAERPTAREAFDILATLARPKSRETTVRVAAEKKTRPVVDDAIRKARDMRNRKHVCDRCGQIVRGTRSTNVVCGVCLEMMLPSLGDDIAAITGNAAMAQAILGAIGAAIPTLRRVDPTPEELLAASDGIGELAIGSAA